MTPAHVAQERNTVIAVEKISDIMAKMCSLDGCKSCEGTCNHEKIMIVMVMIAIALGVAKLLNVF